MEIRNILVTTDFSSEARRSYPAAASIAKRFAAAIHLVHAAESLPSLYIGSEGFAAGLTVKDYHHDLQHVLSQEAHSNETFGGLEVHAALLSGLNPIEALNRFEKENAIDLTVLSTHGRSGLGYALLGSFAEKAVRHLSSPVLTCRGDAKGSSGFHPTKVLVPFDFSAVSEAALPTVRFLAENFSPKFTFLFVIEQLYPAVEAYMGTATFEHLQEAMERAPETARRRFHELSQKELAGVDAALQVAEGSPARETVEKAKELETDLVVSATEGRSGLEQFFLESVAETIVRRAPCSVLTTRAPGGA